MASMVPMVPGGWGRIFGITFSENPPSEPRQSHSKPSACQLLVEPARLASVLIMEITNELANKPSFTLAAHRDLLDLSTNLFRTFIELDRHDISITQEMELGAESILSSIHALFSLDPQHDISPAEMHKLILQRFNNKYNHRHLVICLQKAIAGSNQIVLALCEKCDALCSNFPNSTEISISLANFKSPRPNKYQDFLNGKLYEQIKEHTLCEANTHQERHLARLDSTPDRHPSRLRLGGPQHKEHGEELARFDIVSRSFQGDWIELAWWLSTVSDDDLRDTPQQAVHFLEPDSPIYKIPLPHGFVCESFDSEEQPYRLHVFTGPDGVLSGNKDHDTVNWHHKHEGISLCNVLQHYDLGIGQRILLAHTISQSFWQLYASDLMQSLWTSQSIWFMHAEHDPEEMPDRYFQEIPMAAYVAFDFGDQTDRVPEIDLSLNHRLPHILALGLLLLEVGVGRPLGEQSKFIGTRKEFVSTMHRTVIRSLQEDSAWEDWDSLEFHRDCFQKVIKFCIDYKNWASMISKHRSKHSAKPRSTKPVDDLALINERKEFLYQNVVRPLAVLSMSFYEDKKQITCPNHDDFHSVPTKLRKSKRPTPLPQSARKNLETPRQNDGTSCPQWFADLVHFSGNVQKSRNPYQNCKPTRVAILDTGYHPGVELFDWTPGSIKWQDFTKASSKPADLFGHGTLMTALIRQSCPLAEIHACRVALNNAELGTAHSEISEAIAWAGDNDMDIVMMACGFDETDQSEGIKRITDAMSRVEIKRKADGKPDLVYIVAASNSATYQVDMFPARHGRVIPIYGTEDNGTFMTNPTVRGKLPILGTYGTAPKFICDELKVKFGHFRPEPGASIATAIATGVAATTMAHADMLLQKEQPQQSYYSASAFASSSTCHYDQVHREAHLRLPKLQTAEGIFKILRGMAQSHDSNQRRLFIDPIWFRRDAARSLETKSTEENGGGRLDMEALDWEICDKMCRILSSLS